MKRHIPGLRQAAEDGDDFLEGVFLVRVDRAFYRWHPQKPFFLLRLAILEPKEHVGQIISGRLYCTPRALWRLNWFPRDFGYDTELPFLNLGGFAPAGEWEELSAAPVNPEGRREAGDDL